MTMDERGKKMRRHWSTFLLKWKGLWGVSLCRTVILVPFCQHLDAFKIPFHLHQRITAATAGFTSICTVKCVYVCMGEEKKQNKFPRILLYTSSTISQQAKIHTWMHCNPSSGRNTHAPKINGMALLIRGKTNRFKQGTLTITCMRLLYLCT